MSDDDIDIKINEDIPFMEIQCDETTAEILENLDGFKILQE